jgi:hypothetical protein
LTTSDSKTMRSRHQGNLIAKPTKTKGDRLMTETELGLMQPL